MLLKKDLYLYIDMNDWEKFNEKLLLEKQNFYFHVNIENITDIDYTHTKRVCEDFEIKP